MTKVDKLIINGKIVTVNESMDVLFNGGIAIKDGLIVDLGDSSDIQEKYYSEEVYDAQNKIVMPGLINAHTHVAMTYFRGLADDLSLHSWLSDYIWPAEQNFLNESFVYDASLHGIAEMVRSGTLFFSDMYFFSEQIAEAADKAGIRALLGEGVLGFPMAKHKSSNEMIDYSVKAKERFRNNNLIDFCIAPHAIYTCSADNLKKSCELAKESNMLLHIHLSETKKEVDDCLEKYGKRPVEYLDSLGFLSSNVIAAHGVWVNSDEQKILYNRNVSVVINTKSNLKLASGFAPIKDYIKSGVNICFGTDGVACNNRLNMFDEMSLTAKLHKTINNDPTFLKVKEVVKMATINAAKALHVDNKIGSLEINKEADMIFIDVNNIESAPIYDIYSSLVYSISSNQVFDAMVYGKWILKNRQLVNLDESVILQKSKDYIKKISGFFKK